MRVYSFVLCALLCTTSTAMAQQTVFGVKGGVNLAAVNFDPEPEDDLFDWRTGFVAGLFVVVPVTDLIAFQGEALFSQKGASEDDGNSNLTLDYFEVPLLLRVGTGSSRTTSFHVFTGPSVAFKLRSKLTFETFDGETEEEEIDDEIEGFDFGVVAGAGATFGRFTLDGRYTWGLKNVNSFQPDQMKAKNGVFSIMAGVHF